MAQAHFPLSVLFLLREEKPKPSLPSAVLEALACREALALANDLQLRNVKVASDCLEVINCMKGDYKGKFSSIIKEIRMRA